MKIGWYMKDEGELMIHIQSIYDPYLFDVD
jgi:hypothetical protein